ncbi:hypothetical protein ACA910_002152 [Epithemia clementina (nom. ined.)]
MGPRFNGKATSAPGSAATSNATSIRSMASTHVANVHDSNHGVAALSAAATTHQRKPGPVVGMTATAQIGPNSIGTTSTGLTGSIIGAKTTIATTAAKTSSATTATGSTDAIFTSTSLLPAAPQKQDNQEPTRLLFLNDVCSQLPDLIRSHVHDVIRRNLPQDETTAAYRIAMQEDPQVVLMESDPLHFVRYSHYDLWAGAQRLCLYWKQRLELFGPQRAFLPMTLSGTGALNRQDVLAVYTGSTCFLPKSTTSGRSCILIDRRKWLPSITTENKLRCLYYLASQIVSDNPQSALDAGAALCFIVMVTPRDEDVDWPFLRQAFRTICQVLPIKLQFHFLSIPNHKRLAFAAELINAGITLLRDLFQVNRIPTTKVHVQSEPDRILKDLLDLGLTRQGIPLILGGQWEYEEFYTWCQERQELESALYDQKMNQTQGALKDPPQTVVSFSTSAGMAGTIEDGSGAAGSSLLVAGGFTAVANMMAGPPPSFLLTSSSSTCTNNSGALSSSAGRASSLQNQQPLLATVQSYDAPAHAPSSSLAIDPQEDSSSSSSVVVPDEILAIRNNFSQEDRLHKRRLADLFYSRRKRERKRNEFLSLKDEYESLLSEQNILKTEHEKLKQLLDQAIQTVEEGNILAAASRRAGNQAGETVPFNHTRGSVSAVRQHEQTSPCSSNPTMMIHSININTTSPVRGNAHNNTHTLSAGGLEQRAASEENHGMASSYHQRQQTHGSLTYH